MLGAMRAPTTALHAVIVSLGIVACPAAAHVEITVRTSAELDAALRSATSGTHIKIAPGEFAGGRYVEGISELTIEGTDPKNPPRLMGGTSAWQFSRCNGLTLRNLAVSGQTGNGINIDDGGAGSPTARVTLENLTVADIGPRGNCDGIKCSGIDELTIRGCSVSGWGGQGIDLVGCHKTLIEKCHLVGKEGFTASAGVQVKGGSSEVTIQNCSFKNAGPRPINVGGSTGLEYFRPKGVTYEARDVTIRSNTIEGSDCACAFVGVDGAVFTGNTIVRPTKWIFRILQETTAAGFAPCRDVVISDNSIVFLRAQVKTDINIGPHTSPETFVFKGNSWFAEDAIDQSRPQLPTAESGGEYGRDPRAAGGDPPRP